MPRTIHRNFGIQLQVQENKDFTKILFGSNQEEDKKSISLTPGYEYNIVLDPYGQYSTNDFKGMSLDKRQCRLDHETFDHSTHPIYTKANCEFDCHVKLASESCQCVPWDFVNKFQGSEECDIFGRTCFFNMMETLAHKSDENCTHCIEECDYIKYRRSLGKSNSLKLQNHGYKHCNKYICIDPFYR